MYFNHTPLSLTFGCIGLVYLRRRSLADQPPDTRVEPFGDALMNPVESVDRRHREESIIEPADPGWDETHLYRHCPRTAFFSKSRFPRQTMMPPESWYTTHPFARPYLSFEPPPLPRERARYTHASVVIRIIRGKKNPRACPFPSRRPIHRPPP